MARVQLPLVVVLISCDGRTSDPPPSASPTAADPSIGAVVVDELQSAKRDTAATEGRMLHAAAQMYIATQAVCPTSVEALAEAKMIPKVSVDPWGAGYVIACKDQGATLTITSHGPDGKPGTADDVVVASDGS